MTSMSVTKQQHYFEADQIALYIVGKHAGDRERALYSRAMTRLDPRLTEAESDLWASMIRSRRRMAWADAGLSLIRPSSVLRWKLLVMVAVLETSPNFADHFLPRRCPPFRAIRVAAAAIRGAFRGAAGLILVKSSRV
jgi:hypothetical protein